MMRSRNLRLLFVFVTVLLMTSAVPAGMKTFDGRHSIDRIEVTVVYFLPKDREPLADWKERVGYFCRRIEQFHAREFDGQSVLKTLPREEPFRSARTTQQLRNGDANFIFFRTLEEVDAALNFGSGKDGAWPILLVLSDINWKPLDDFYRLKPGPNGPVFEGQLINGRHFPGAESGGARATYLADRGKGWGLVSADGWRVPYSGTDCVVYHEGVGHTIGLPHPEPGDGDVMSFGQYRGWISESWVNEAQKKKLGWQTPMKPTVDRRTDLYSTFTAIPEPAIPKPGEDVAVKLRWPDGVKLKTLRVRMQTELAGPWLDVAVPAIEPAPQRMVLGKFDRATPVSYRIDAAAVDGQTTELWGYLQVRDKPDETPQPRALVAASSLGSSSNASAPISSETQFVAPIQPPVELLPRVDPAKNQVAGTWTKDGALLVSPKQYGARIELPYQPPAEYDLTVVVEPLDEPGGLLFGQRLGGHRFVTLIHYGEAGASAIENVDGMNVGNETTVTRKVLSKGRVSQIICRVRKNSVKVLCDGDELLNWTGDARSLSLSDYWKTPHDDLLFLGAYDCRYRFYRVAVTPVGPISQ